MSWGKEWKGRKKGKERKGKERKARKGDRMERTKAPNIKRTDKHPNRCGRKYENMIKKKVGKKEQRNGKEPKYTK